VAILFNLSSMELIMTLSFCSFLSTPIGELGIFADEKAIYRIEFLDVIKSENMPKESAGKSNVQENELTLVAKQQLAEYFSGSRTDFNLTLAPQGTPFRQQTWQALLQIPYGETRYYSQQAELMNNKKAVRAVGAANGANPIAIVIPCHRVIGKDGSLTGYAGGLHRKEWLLNFEREQTNNQV
jgi:O-6-methylguanine DNA methyltransferase